MVRFHRRSASAETRLQAIASSSRLSRRRYRFGREPTVGVRLRSFPLLARSGTPAGTAPWHGNREWRRIACSLTTRRTSEVTRSERGRRMSGPFIFIATNRLRPGAYEAERRRVPGLVDFIEAGEPRLLAFNENANAERTEVTVVQVHPDAASMEFHMSVGRERAAQAYSKTLDATTQIQVFGTPSDAVVETLRVQAGAGVPLSVHPEHLGGFTRIGEHFLAGEV